MRAGLCGGLGNLRNLGFNRDECNLREADPRQRGCHKPIKAESELYTVGQELRVVVVMKGGIELDWQQIWELFKRARGQV